MRKRRKLVYNPDKKLNAEKTELEEWDDEKWREENADWNHELMDAGVETAEDYERELGLD